MEDFKDKKLSELRQLFPDIKDTSKAGFLKQIAEIEVEVEEVPEPKKPAIVLGGVQKRKRKELPPEVKLVEMDIEAIEDLLFKEGGQKESYLIRTETKTDADDAYIILYFGLQSRYKKADLDTLLMGRQGSHEIHIGGRTFVKITCKPHYGHFVQSQRWNHKIDIIE